MNQSMRGSRATEFVCRFCFKSFPCGKSLGGHIRVHKNEKPARVAVNQKDRTSIVKLQVSTSRTRSRRDLESEDADGNSSHGLRANPKMAQRFAGSRFASTQDMFCRECGKGFRFSEPQCGHLARHSENEGRNKRLDDRLGKLGFEDDRSESTESSSSIQKMFEATDTLMIMSRDRWFKGWGGLDSVAESSDKKSSSRHFRESVTSTSKSSGRLEIKVAKGRRLEFAECGDQNSDPENLSETCKKVKLKAPVNESIMDGEYKKSGAKCGFSIRRSSAEILKNSMKNAMNSQVHTSSSKYGLRKRSRDDSYSPDLLDGSHKKMRTGHSFHSESVHSHHRESHKRMTDVSELTHQSGETSTSTALNSISMPDRELTESSSGKNKSYQDTSGNEEKKMGPKRRHKCTICSKLLKSGQALGGHMRSHTLESSEDRLKKQETGRVNALLDLNVPAPVEEDEDSWDR